MLHGVGDMKYADISAACAGDATHCLEADSVCAFPYPSLCAGPGVGKGRQISAAIMENFAKGRTKVGQLFAFQYIGMPGAGSKHSMWQGKNNRNGRNGLARVEAWGMKMTPCACSACGSSAGLQTALTPNHGARPMC